MNIETLIRDTFVSREHLAPEADVTHDALAQQLSAGRPSRPRMLVAVAATVAVVVGLSVALALNGRSPRSAPVNHPQAVVESFTMPFDLGGLPPGTIHYTERGFFRYGISSYQLTVETAGATFQVNVFDDASSDAQSANELAQGRLKLGCSQGSRDHDWDDQPTTVHGRPGVETLDASGPCGYQTMFLLAHNGSATVQIHYSPGSHGPAATLIRIGRSLARHLSTPGTTRVTPTFGVGYLPAGLLVSDETVQVTQRMGKATPTGMQTIYDLGRPGSHDTVVNISGPGVEVHGVPGRRVQGHPTRITDNHGFIQMSLLGALPNGAVVVSATLPLATLYRIAQGLVLPH
jgi:hypothetical protein